MDDEIQIRSVQTAFEILEVLVKTGGETPSHLAERLGRPGSTIHDYLRSLEQMGYAVAENGEYRASLRLLDQGERVRQSMRIYDVVAPRIDALAKQTGERVSLIIEENGLGVLVYSATGDEDENPPHAGAHEYLHVMSGGKAILAHFSQARIEQIIDRYGLKEYTENTITDRERLLEELDTVRTRGYAICEAERYYGLNGVAVGLRPNKQLAGAISVYGPSTRLDGERLREDLPERLVEFGNIIEVDFNYQ